MLCRGKFINLHLLLVCEVSQNDLEDCVRMSCKGSSNQDNWVTVVAERKDKLEDAVRNGLLTSSAKVTVTKVSVRSVREMKYLMTMAVAYFGQRILKI